MKPIYVHLGGALALTFTIAACVPAPDSTPAPTATPAPAPPPPPPVTVQPVPQNWMDAPQTPGDWSYRAAPSGGTAIFGLANSDARLSLRCDRAQRQITLARAGTATGPTALRILTEHGTRALVARPSAGGMSMLEVTLAATDPILPAMAFSKGRFAIETQGLPTLYLPAWPEVTRVIEDCR